MAASSGLGSAGGSSGPQPMDVEFGDFYAGFHVQNFNTLINVTVADPDADNRINAIQDMARQACYQVFQACNQQVAHTEAIAAANLRAIQAEMLNAFGQLNDAWRRHHEGVVTPMANEGRSLEQKVAGLEIVRNS